MQQDSVEITCKQLPFSFYKLSSFIVLFSSFHLNIYNQTKTATKYNYVTSQKFSSRGSAIMSHEALSEITQTHDLFNEIIAPLNQHLCMNLAVLFNLDAKAYR